MNKRTLIVIGIVLIAVILVSSLIVLKTFNSPEGSSVLWQRPIENFATGLAADDGKVFTLDINGNAISYDVKTGSSIWNGSTKTGYWSSGLTTSDGRIYAGGPVASVSCLDETTGQFQWSFNGQIATDAWDKRAPDDVIVTGGRVFAIDGGVSAHNATSGEFLWQASPLEPSPNFGEFFGNLTDSKIWWVGAYPLGGFPFENNFVYALGGNLSNEFIYKINTDNGLVLWSSNITLLANPLFPPLVPGFIRSSLNVLAIYQGQVVIQNGNQILSLNDTSGDSLWSINVDASIYSPTAYSGVLLFGASDGNFYGLDLLSGAISCKTKVDSQNLFTYANDTNTPLVSPIQVDSQNQQIYWSFGANQQNKYKGTIVSLDLATCKVLWTRQIEDSPVSLPVGLVFNKDSIFLTETNALWIFNAETGNLAQNQRFDHYVLVPIASDNEVLVASDLKLTAYG